ncbi:uncharacterized protein EURHEDRAFT_378493 [Aspergillus ruber CBS 135680]|uniref:Uncharacterized protein n=1 Tax=Aspergillus ruber (strain CBS 135680) TaxID=1388766 RepID=A0A017SBB1_ASPRC|nr:uncharacterized protein EURHEDRAFT_378493 [Aspergillus ruber CBS 135680]EYE94227.1 hypothetical protein EURHEDRAFT_378493 [Aspergillus ruber CBS 135680]
MTPVPFAQYISGLFTAATISPTAATTSSTALAKSFRKIPVWIALVCIKGSLKSQCLDLLFNTYLSLDDPAGFDVCSDD